MGRLVSLVAILLVASASVARAVPPTFTVNSSADSAGTCPGTGTCTLRTAITDANASTGSTIQFSGVTTIKPSSALPTIVKPTTLAGGGVELDGSGAGANAAGLSLGAGSDHSAVAGLTIVRFGGDGIDVNGAGSIAIRDNSIGTTFVFLTTGLGNGGNGIKLTGSTGDTIGVGVGGPAGNTIAGNSGDGILADSASNATIQNNRIGNDPDDDTLPNGSNGIELLGKSSIIGGVGAGNVITSNHGNGIDLGGDGAGPNTISGNTIGLRDDGVMAGNDGSGISVDRGPNNVIGGSAPGAGNTISGNQFEGVELEFASGTQILGNRIGTSPDGAHLRPNFQFGVQEFDASNTAIGGGSAGDGNLISANLLGGVELQDGTGNNVVQGNVIGLNAQRTFGLPNGEGIDVFNESGDVIGGPGSAANAIAFNDGPGIGITASDAVIAENSVFSNFGLGIDQGSDGVTPNDAGDSDGVQNFPVLTAAVSGNGETTLQGTIDTGPNRRVFLRFYASPGCDQSGFGEGTTPLENASTDFLTSGTGHESFTETFSGAVAPGQKITATAEGLDIGSSEFSACITVHPLDHVTLAPRTQNAPEGTTATVTVKRTGTLSVDGSIDFATHNGTARAGRDYRRTHGQLFFKAGQITKTIHVPILSDVASEGAESFTVSLGRANLLVPGTPSTVSITIPANHR